MISETPKRGAQQPSQVAPSRSGAPCALHAAHGDVRKSPRIEKIAAMAIASGWHYAEPPPTLPAAALLARPTLLVVPPSCVLCQHSSTTIATRLCKATATRPGAVFSARAAELLAHTVHRPRVSWPFCRQSCLPSSLAFLTCCLCVQEFSAITEAHLDGRAVKNSKATPCPAAAPLAQGSA